ncbi:MAG: PTS sugar transporter subunit IIA [Spirochaetaceae bacterium]|jgi:excisionase family DNA binding protein|nr:PTS sugar transporter subunit IIA [Spirochaetaceae bacterium]
MSDINPLMTLSDVAGFLQLSEKTILKMVKNNEIPCTKIANQWRFSQEILNDWITSKMRVLPQNDLSRLIETDFDLVPLSRLLREQNIIELDKTTKLGVLKELADNAYATNLISDKSTFLESLIEREEMSSTQICSGIALPHLRSPSEKVVNAARIVIGYSKEGIDFDSHSNEKTNILFLLISDSEVVHLKILSKISRILQNPENVKEVRAMDKKDDFLNFFLQYDKKIMQENNS